MKHNVLPLAAVGDFGDVNYLPALNLIQITKLEFSTSLYNEAQALCLRAGDVGGCRFCHLIFFMS